jgi:FG-GAP-like repeat
MLGDGTGGFGLPTSYPLAGGFGVTFGVAVADLNGDGSPDLLATGGNSNVSVWLGDGSGVFGPSTLYSLGGGSSPRRLRRGTSTETDGRTSSPRTTTSTN